MNVVKIGGLTRTCLKTQTGHFRSYTIVNSKKKKNYLVNIPV